MNDVGIRSQLVAIGRRAVGSGLVVGAGGNLSARIPDSDRILITPTGYRLEDLTSEQLVPIGLDGQVHGSVLKPSSEWPMHTAAFVARPDANAVIHLHPPFATLLSSLGRQIRLITIDHSYYVREIAELGYYHSGTNELAKAVAATLDRANVVIFAHHGCLVVADSLDLAFHRVLNLEEAAKATYRASMLGDSDTSCPPEYLERVRALEVSADGYSYGQPR